MRALSMLGLVTFALAISNAHGVEQTYLSGATMRTASEDMVQLTPQDYSALLASLTGQRPQQSVSSQTSHQVGLHSFSCWKPFLNRSISHGQGLIKVDLCYAD